MMHRIVCFVSYGIIGIVIRYKLYRVTYTKYNVSEWKNFSNRSLRRLNWNTFKNIPEKAFLKAGFFFTWSDWSVKD